MEKHLESGSVSSWIDRTRNGDAEAALRLWNRYFQALTEYARTRLPTHLKRVADEEDIAIQAFSALLDGFDQQRFNNVKNRDELWQLLTLIVERKAVNQIKHESRKKRGGGRNRGDSAMPVEPGATADDPFRDPNDPAWIAEFSETCRNVFAALPSDEIREIARLRLAGHSVAEIAEITGRAERTIERKLQIIRETWDRNQ